MNRPLACRGFACLDLPARRGFSLVELLVVITIIVILLALLTPALDKAVYQAELVNCAGRLKTLATGTLTYAFDHTRSYPHREGAKGANNWLPNYVCTRDFNERPVLFSYLRPINLLDPFAGGIDIETNQDGPVIYVNYLMWFGFKYNGAGQRGMYRVGDRFTWTDAISQRPGAYHLLASDEDTLRSNNAFGTHHDREGTMNFKWTQDYPGGAIWWAGQGNWLTFSWWDVGNGTNHRGLLDLNFAYDDGSVLRLDAVQRQQPDGGIGDPRMSRIPEGKLPNSEVPLGYGRQVPTQ